MSDVRGPARLSALSTRQRRRLYARALVRPTLTAALLIVGYFLLPLESSDEDSPWLLLVGGLALVAAVTAWQIWEIIRAKYPLLQAVEALAAILPVYLLAFAATYVLMSRADTANFTEQLTHMSALYFSVVVFSTVGFGDITPHTDAARAVVTGQIIGNLLILAFGLRLVLAAVRRGQSRQSRSES